jgi:chromosome segregation ATPase
LAKIFTRAALTSFYYFLRVFFQSKFRFLNPPSPLNPDPILTLCFKAFEAEISGLTAEKTALEGDINFFRREKESSDSQLEAANRRVEELEDSVKSFDEEKIRLTADRDSLQNSNQELKNRLSEYEDRMSSYAEKISQLNDIVSSKEAALERQREVENNINSY